MENIQLTFPDGRTQEFPRGIKALDVAASLGPRLAREALAAKVNGRLIDLSSPIEESAPIQFIMPSSPEGIEVYRHSSAHLLAAAVLELFPYAHPVIGPPTETGFFYDFIGRGRSRRMICGSSNRRWPNW